MGRSKDLIITGGYNVYPAEVEGYLNDMPGVAESAVVGVPHPDFGEGVVAVVVARPGVPVAPAGLIDALKARIANFKVPKHLFVVPSCRAMPWARCRRTCCGSSTGACSRVDGGTSLQLSRALLGSRPADLTRQVIDPRSRATKMNPCRRPVA